MIRANRQLIPDKTLFNNCQRLKASQIQCSPHIQNCLTEMETLIDNLMLQFNERLLKLQDRIEHIYSQLKRVNAAIKYKHEKKIFSFANSPNSKSMYNFPQSANKIKNSQQKLSNQYNSTEPKTRYKSVQEFSNQKILQQESYTQNQMSTLRHQIIQLKRQLFKIHGWNQQQNEVCDNFNRSQSTPHIRKFKISYLDSSYKKYESIDKIIPSQYNQCSVEGIQIIERYKAIIKQYQKQQQILRILANKSDKYRNGLSLVLQWLKDLRQVQLPKYLPCQHCQLRSSLLQYLNSNPLQARQPTCQRQYNKNQSLNENSNTSLQVLQVEQYCKDENDSDLIQSQKDDNNDVYEQS